MIRWSTAVLAVSLCATPAFAQGKVLLETWDAAYLSGNRSGYVHTIAQEVERGGKKLIRTSVALSLTIKRFEDTVTISMENGNYETPDGQITGVFSKLVQGKLQQQEITGEVVGKELKLTLNGNRPLLPAPWNPKVVSLYKQQTIFRDRKLKPDEKFNYLSFEPSINLVLKTEVIAKGYREVELVGSKQKKKLLQVETVPDKVDFVREGKKEKMQLPIVQTYLDEDLLPVKSEVEVPGFGVVVMYRTTKEKALAPVSGGLDLGVSQLVRLKNRILRPHETTAAVYRITIRGDNPEKAFSSDDRQQVKNVQGNTFELHVRANGNGAAPGKEPAAEFSQSSYFITSADGKVKELARQAVGAEADSWKKALKIERWVNKHMRFTSHETLATADHVARTLEGDCTEYAMLTAAMCRAEGIPSRTAIGLIYAEPREIQRAPCFAFHMWTEVWIKGRWIPLDATLGKGYVGATHLKITDSSWPPEERTSTPIFPVTAVVGRVGIEVLSAETR
ncbi:MAG TPA: transglutaminase domain-containing protein [Gemmataceae bacterium]|nr:transglutaminase domain-containing protein [Gemmataceae bacterium]